MDEPTTKHIEAIIDLLGKSLETLDYSLEKFVNLAMTLPKEDQTKVKESIGLILEHMEASCRDVRLAISPIPNHVSEYLV